MKKAALSLKYFISRWYKHLLALPLFFLFFIVTKLVYTSFHNPVSDSDFKNFLFSDYKLLGVTIPKDLNFCGEKVPTDKFAVKKALEKEFFVNAFFQPQSLILNKKAARWFPVIEPILKRNGVPDDFKYVAILESGLTNSTDQPKAGGFWQVMPPVAREYGLEITEEVDERFNIEKETDVACKIFKDAYKKYNNWTLAAAAYDMGSGALDKQLAKQGTRSYYELDLNDETAMYIYRLLAFKELITRPEAYGYKIRPRDLFAPIPTYGVKVDSSISNLAAFAVANGSSYEVLKTMNPWLLKPHLNNPSHKTYTILFPKKGVKLYGMDLADSSTSKKPSIRDTAIRKPEIFHVADSLPK